MAVMDCICFICEKKRLPEHLSDLAKYATEFYNITLYKISQTEDKHLLKICKVCRDKLLQFDTFRTHCLEVYKKFTQSSKHLCTSPAFVKVEDNIDDIHRLDDNESEHTKLNLKLKATQNDGSNEDASGCEERDMEDKNNVDACDENEKKTTRTPQACHVCGKVFRNKNILEGHIRVHQGLKPALCKLCGKAFIRWHSLKLHVLQKHTERRVDVPSVTFSCDFEGCESTFTTKQGMFRHRKKHEPGYTKPARKTFVCELCGKTFSSKASLQKHSFIHTGNMPFHCEVCDKRYPTKHKLKEHTMRHQGIKNHTCPHCGLKKTTMHELRVHMNYHTKEKTFPCDFCKKVFMNSGNLATHVKTVHQRLTPFNCIHCSRSFGKKESLKRHVMTHTGEKPHACTVCGKRFIQLVALQSHSKVHAK